VIRGGLVVDPAQEINERRDIAVSRGRVAAVEARISGGNAKRVLDASGMLVTPGLVDLHAHTARDVTRVSIDADRACLLKGTTTVVDAGSTGEILFPSFRKFVLDKSRIRMFALINIESPGMVYLTGSSGPQEIDRLWAELTTAMNEQYIPLFVNMRNTVKTIKQNRSVIVGIKWAHHRINGMALAREAADKAGCMLMIENRFMPDCLKYVKKGDVITHTYGNWAVPEAGLLSLVEDGKVKPDYFKAVRRGVKLDVGHGLGSFSWRVAEIALREGLAPFSISTDLWAGNIAGPVFDLPTTMTKFLHLGMSLEDVIRASTWNPASLIQSQERFGTLKPGSCADVALFKLSEGRFPLIDSSGEGRTATKKLVPMHVVRAGKVVL